MTEIFPAGNGDHAPMPLSPEQERLQRAGMVYMRYLCGRLEGELYPPQGLYRTAIHNDPTPEYILIAVGEDRSLKINNVPDEVGESREITYNTTISTIGYTGTPDDTVYVQAGSSMRGPNPPGPLEQADIDFLDGFLARKLPIPEVIESVRAQVRAIINPPDAQQT